MNLTQRLVEAAAMAIDPELEARDFIGNFCAPGSRVDVARSRALAVLAAVYPMIQADVIEECATAAEPAGVRTCGCVGCDCQNIDDAQAAAFWDGMKSASLAVRGLKKGLAP